jgi:hypothetical protein
LTTKAHEQQGQWIGQRSNATIFSSSFLLFYLDILSILKKNEPMEHGGMDAWRHGATTQSRKRKQELFFFTTTSTFSIRQGYF